MIDQSDFDFRPASRRRSGGLDRWAGMLACTGSIGSPERQSQSVVNEQTTVQGATGATTIALGAGAEGQVSIVSSDADVVNNAINANTSATNNALLTAANATNNALEANAQVSTAAINANAASTQSFLQFGAETVQGAENFAGNIVGQIESSNAQLQYQDNQTVANISDQLAQITANAAPQSTAAEQELLNGVSPTQSSTETVKTNWTGIAIGLAAVVTVLAFLRGGKTA